MNGVHDLGGLQGFGPIEPEPQSREPVFHASWEERVFALTLASGMLGQWNIDQSRYARERQHPVDYLQNSYYESWLAGLLTLLQDHKLVSPEEILSGKMTERINKALKNRVATASQVPDILARGSPTEVEAEDSPGFAVGDKVRVRVRSRRGHTRMPAYVRGQIGTVALYHGAHIFPDDNARGIRHGQHLYNICFDAAELWENGSGQVHVDLWQDYLQKPGV